MSKFSKVFFASDFDHTLTDQQGNIPKANVEAIEYFIAHGGIFTVASGRSIPMFGSRYEAVPINAPCILYNGSACYDYAAKQLHYAHTLDDFALEILEKIRRENPDLTTEDIFNYISDIVKDINTKFPSYKKIRAVSIRNTEFIKTTTQKVKRYANMDDNVEETTGDVPARETLTQQAEKAIGVAVEAVKETVEKTVEAAGTAYEAVKESLAAAKEEAEDKKAAKADEAAVTEEAPAEDVAAETVETPTEETTDTKEDQQ